MKSGKFNISTAMVKTINEYFTTIVSFIPKKFANVGSYVKIKDNDVWTNGWLVQDAGPDIEEALLPNSHDDIKGHRKMTGDALRKQS